MHWEKYITLLTLLPLSIFSATFNVSNTAELRQALENAAHNGENDTIILQPGRYVTTSDGKGTFTFHDDEEYNLTIQGAAGYDRSEIVLNGDNTDQVMNLTNAHRPQICLPGKKCNPLSNHKKPYSRPFLNLKNLSILYGKADSKGGGFYTDIDVLIKNCNISYNANSFKESNGFYAGGRVKILDSIISYNEGEGFHCDKTVEINNSKIIYNKDNGFTSTGLVKILDSSISNNGEKGFLSYIVEVNNSIISNNGGDGFSASSAKIINSTISNNKGNGFSSSGTIEVNNSIISNNGGDGFSASSAKIINSTISNNKGNGFSSSGTIEVNNSIISNNGRYGFISDYGSIYVTNSTISSNRGSGFYSSSYHHSAMVINSKISKNGNNGFTSHSSVTVINSFILNNRYYGFFSSSNSIIINNNFINNPIHSGGLIANNIFFINQIKDNSAINYFFSNSEFSWDSNEMQNKCIYSIADSKLYNNYINYEKIDEHGFDITKESNLLPSIVGDIRLEDDNITLQSDSPAIDAGLNPDDELFKRYFDNAQEYAKILKYLKTDYFGNPRIVNGRIDIGASEYGNPPAHRNKPKITIEISSKPKIYHPVIIHLNIESPNEITELYIDKGNGYESIDPTIRSFTITFDTPGDHPIKIKAIDDQGNVAQVLKIITIENLSVQEAIEFGKHICQKDPTSCGISISSGAKEMIFTTPKEHIKNILVKKSNYNITGYFIHYNDPISANPLFDWIYISSTLRTVKKLQGMKSDGSFSWSENLANLFSSIILSKDGRNITFK
ncbi:hypothetical protein NitYY0826_C1357 [Nitratiruptor sp. YY08-26]|uniref:right-handed parallel beta-helix repeat-containing protein n=1 Tax=unclassified Nitratiruptor TaxID=2624044 RepID=UPI0019158CC1|nr:MULTISPECIES: right-handed parallel beta-helix repeat-containing protein [unclassified Nitratiruptor]BCD62481.1 hypothetical protein NitYY0813_C1355 [Nitratiruptor sp. YY08-13]BCD66417.1 hypothetical protein NitYY0826_C1357 [Nitratiruptor sp. YY08-26]